ncbi:unnamed protein product [Acanthoscelides obtectus]|uniref:C2H2-type domain-containing protein n=1 Tax=Acanthoscelides obtectus TaxID=200917 RepID=A0A9P0P8Q7_ACAOB|nr:unnamed protein product [Acanthoscelides obtectus]CAK1664818.1 Zinc finger protein 711 [Acanthoscelides obtectus]
MEQENQLYGKEFEVLEVPCDHVKSEKEPVSVMQKENIKVENNFEGNKSEITHVFIKDEYGQCINTGLDNTVAVSDRSYKAPDKIANFDHNFIRFGVLKRHDKKIEFQKDLDNIIYKVTEDSDQLTIKKENDEQRFINEGTEIVLNRAAAEHDFTKPLIKCEALEELKLDTDLDIETCGSTENIEEYMFTNDNDHILKQPRADGIHKPNDCVHCDMTFSVKRNLDDHIIRKHPDFIAEVSSKIYACAHCTFKTTIKEGLVRHMRKRPGAESDYKPKKCVHCNVTFRIKRTLDDHIIRKHPDFIAEVSTKIHACTHCTYKSTIKENLVQHMLKHPEAEGRHMDKHMEAEGGCEPKSCFHCNATFKSKRNLDDHIVKNHPGFTAEISSKIHVCAHCTYKTARKDGLVRHLLIHSGAEDDTKLKKCVHCNGAFRRKTTLDDHIIKKHPGYISSVSSKVHECIYCMYKTTIKGKLAKHMLNHPDFTAYKSSIKGNLVKHMLKHPGAKVVLEDVHNEC